MSIRCNKCRFWADLPRGEGYSTNGISHVKEWGRCVCESNIQRMRLDNQHRVRDGRLPDHFYKTSYGDYCVYGEEAPPSNGSAT